MSNFPTSKANTVPGPKSKVNSVPAAKAKGQLDIKQLKLHGTTLYLLDNLHSAHELQMFQTCLRAWFMAYISSVEKATPSLFDAPESECQEPEQFLYVLLDTLFDSLLCARLTPTSGEADHASVYGQIADTFRHMGSDIITNKDYVRDWFFAFTKDFNSRFDDFNMAYHTFAHGAIMELFYALIYQTNESGNHSA